MGRIRKTNIKHNWHLILTKDFLIECHYNKDMSIIKIANEIGCTPKTVYKHFKKNNIIFRKSELLFGKHQGGSPRGNTPWNKGFKGVTIGWPKGKPRPKGEDSPHWKGGSNRPNDVLLKTWRRSVYERDNYTCQECFTRGGNLNAHHIKSWCRYNELRYDISNGLTLCEPCHKALHRRSKNKKNFSKFSNSNVLTIVP